MSDSIFSLIPPILAIFLAIWTKRTLLSLFAACWLGTTMLAGGNPFLGFLDLLEKHIITVLTKPGNITIVIYASCFGGLMLILQKTGGILAIGNFFIKIVKTSRIAGISTFLLGIIIFIDDYFSCIAVGNIMRPICDRLKICREKLAFLVDTTAAPICLLVPISTWVVYVTGLISEIVPKDPSFNGYIIFLSTIPINFYCLFALLGTAILLIGNISFGTMYSAEERCSKLGQLWRSGAILPSDQDTNEITSNSNITPSLLQIVLPFLALFFMAGFMFLYTGNYWKKEEFTMIDALKNCRSGISIAISVLFASGVALFMGAWKKHFTLSEGSKYYVTGMKSMFNAILILTAAWSMSSLTKELGTAKYIGEAIHNAQLSSVFIPVIIFFLGCAISFTTGTSYGTFAILMPLAIPLSLQMNIPIEYSIAAVFSGGVFGDHCSPISDTTVLSATGSCCDLTDHTKTQLPYALWFAVSSATAFIILPKYGLILAFISSIIVAGVTLTFLTKWKPTSNNQ